MSFAPMHLAKFKTFLPAGSITHPCGAHTPKDWVNISTLRGIVAGQPQSRTELLQMASDSATPINVLCWSVFAWGGMRRANRDHLQNVKDLAWLRLAEQIRAGQYNRQQAYDAFSALAKDKRLSGVGPAFFTKLIYFLMPRQSAHPIGYIMDQWVGCAVNLLVGREVVLADISASWKAQINGGWGKREVNFWMSSKNTGRNYEDYCQQLEALADEIGHTSEDTEFLLMYAATASERWRDYVVNERVLPK